MAGVGARCCSRRRGRTGTWGPRECERLLRPPARARAARRRERGGASEAARVGPWECRRAGKDARVDPSSGARGPTVARGGGRQGTGELRRHHQQRAVSSVLEQPTVWGRSGRRRTSRGPSGRRPSPAVVLGVPGLSTCSEMLWVKAFAGDLAVPMAAAS
ncbi:hypothetical protein C2845_PM02G01660 [Panicum miliaceum]|uniref:Uncharacterized protein n=1 Tax=Panicum miliaceum TaxID=4540 RepID=A0A3L6S9T3_PANMI|nr:hypothetical protein C2845_PM02G01660 [Panicum miliaceum]